MTRIFKNILYIFITCNIVFSLWLAGLFVFIENIRHNTPPTSKQFEHVKTAVVLTGGENRLSAGFQLLESKKIDMLFISGVYPSVTVTELLDIWKTGQHSLSCCINLGYKANDTRNNAIETHDWVKAQKTVSSFWLITSHYHMERALLEFKNINPKFEVIPYPISPTDFNLKAWWQTPSDRDLILREYNKYLVASVRIVLG